MYSMIRRKSKNLILIPVAVMCAIYLLFYMTVGFAATKVHVPGTLSVEAVKGEFKSLYNVDEQGCSVAVSGNTAQLSVAGLKGPGASAVATITARNTGTLDATVVDVAFEDTGVDYIIAKGADIPVGEVLAPGDECVFDVVVFWDAERDDILSSNEAARFSMVITYENDEHIESDTNIGDNITGDGSEGESGSGGSGEVPKTGDDNGEAVFTAIAAVCGAVLIICIILFFVGKKKKKEDAEDEK